MCDYSLHFVKSRPAKVADRLVTARFDNSHTRGFAGVGEPEVAVCLRPGTELAFDDNIEYENFWGMLPHRKVDWSKAQFRHVRPDDPHAHHDALEFPDGQIVLLTRLCEGQRATVLQLPAEPSATDEERSERKQLILIA